MKKCPYCGNENDERAKVCEKCFAGFPAEKQDKPVKKAEKKPSNKE